MAHKVDWKTLKETEALRTPRKLLDANPSLAALMKRMGPDGRIDARPSDYPGSYAMVLRAEREDALRTKAKKAEEKRLKEAAKA